MHAAGRFNSGHALQRESANTAPGAERPGERTGMCGQGPLRVSRRNAGTGSGYEGLYGVLTYRTFSEREAPWGSG